MHRFGGFWISVALLAVTAWTMHLGAPALSAQGPLQAVGPPMEHKFHPLAMHFSPDGSRLLTIGGAVWLWDVGTQRIGGDGIMGPHRVTGENRPPGSPLDGDKFCVVVAAAFTPDSKALVVVSQGFVQRWDPVKGRPLTRGVPIVTAGGRSVTQKLETLQGPAVFRRDGKIVLAQYGSSQAVPKPGKLAIQSEYQGLLIDTATGKLVGSPLRYNDHVKVKNRSQVKVQNCAFTEDGKQVITLHGNGEVRVWDAATGKAIQIALQLPERGKRHFSPDGKTVATVGYDKVQLWDLTTGKMLAAVPRHLETPRLAFSPDGRTIAVPGPDNEEDVQVLTVPALKIQAKLRQSRPIHELLFSPDGKMLLTLAENAPMMLWDAATGKQCGRIERDREAGYQMAAFGPDGALLATAIGVPLQAGPPKSRVQLWRLPVVPK